MKNKEYINFVKDYAKKNNKTYMCVISEASKEYKKQKEKQKEKKKEPKTTLSEILENRKKAEKQAKEGSSKMRRNQKQIYNSKTEKKQEINDVPDLIKMLNTFKDIEKQVEIMKAATPQTQSKEKRKLTSLIDKARSFTNNNVINQRLFNSKLKEVLRQ